MEAQPKKTSKKYLSGEECTEKQHRTFISCMAGSVKGGQISRQGDNHYKPIKHCQHLFQLVNTCAIRGESVIFVESRHSMEHDWLQNQVGLIIKVNTVIGWFNKGMIETRFVEELFSWS